MNTLTLVVISALICASSLCGSQSEAETEQVQREYTNTKYLYSVQLPAGVVATTMRPPAPQHGFKIVPRPSEHNVAIWVDGSYDALDLASPEKLAKQAARHLCASYHLSVVKESPTHLAMLDARDIVLRGRNGPEDINYVHLLVAFRPLPERVVGIVYTIGVQARSEDKALDDTFAAIVRSFTLATVPD